MKKLDSLDVMIIALCLFVVVLFALGSPSACAAIKRGDYKPDDPYGYGGNVIDFHSSGRVIFNPRGAERLGGQMRNNVQRHVDTVKKHINKPVRLPPCYGRGNCIRY